MDKRNFLKAGLFVPIFAFTIACFTDASSQGLRNYKEGIINFFKVSLFEISADSFLKNLLIDPGLRIDSIQLSTDTSLMYLRGYFNDFNPFSEEVNLVQVHFYQHEFPDSRNKNKDTSLSYYLIGVCDTGRSGKINALKAEKKIHDKLQQYISNVRSVKMKSKNKKFSPIWSYYYIGPYPVAFSGINTWYLHPQYYCVVLNIDFGFVNRADLLLNISRPDN